jgi:hypothetical protein
MGQLMGERYHTESEANTETVSGKYAWLLLQFSIIITESIEIVIVLTVFLGIVPLSYSSQPYCHAVC